jgi:hypothetical protein
MLETQNAIMRLIAECLRCEREKGRSPSMLEIGRGFVIYLPFADRVFGLDITVVSDEFACKAS